MADYPLSKRTDLYAESVAQIGANNAGGKRVVMYRPQIMKWTGNRVEGRAALAIVAERGIYTYGVARFSGRADICRATHHVRFT